MRQSSGNCHMEQQMFQPGEDGKYRWQYELDMKNNKSILWTVLRILILCMAGLWILMLVLFSGSGDFFPRGVLAVTILFVFITAAMVLLAFLTYLIAMKVKGGVYLLKFEMDDRGVKIVQSKSTVSRNKAMGAAVALGAMASGNPVNAGPAAGMMMSEHIAHTYFANIRRVKERRRYNMIDIRESMGANQIYAPDEIYDQILNFIRSHVR